jgi:hypothetical protein
MKGGETLLLGPPLSQMTQHAERPRHFCFSCLPGGSPGETVASQHVGYSKFLFEHEVLASRGKNKRMATGSGATMRNVSTTAIMMVELG